MKSIKEIWDSMSPEERVCVPAWENLSERILLASWDELDDSAKDAIILLCPKRLRDARKEVKL